MNIWIKAGIRDYTLISRCDYSRLCDKKISASTVKGSTRCHVWINRKQLPLSRFILNCSVSHMDVDHVSRDPMDNTRENLRVCTRQENNNNKWVICTTRASVFKGVTICKSKNAIYWEALDRFGERMKSKMYYSEKYAYHDYCLFKAGQIKEYFYYKPLSVFPLEAVQPRRARVSSRNKTGFKGVTINNKMARPYSVNLYTNGKNSNLGFFDCPIEAAKVYDKEAFKHQGFLALLNFPVDYRIFL